MATTAEPFGASCHDPAVLLYDSERGEDGHRAEYYQVFRRVIGAERIISLRHALLAPQPVLVGMVERNLGTYFLLAMVRMVLRRRTAALLFRALPAATGTTLRLRFKRQLLRLLRHMPGVTTFAIVPFHLEPRISRVANDWIDDPQLWDLHYPESAFELASSNGQLIVALREQAAGRKVCSAVGRQDRSKGFHQFAQLYRQREDLRVQWLFALGGKIAAQSNEDLESLLADGAFALARFIDRQELLDLYAGTDLIWCCYDPTYDQASGIFGRAVQMGIPVVVRTGSLIHAYSQTAGLPHIAYSGNPVEFELDHIPTCADPEIAARQARARGRTSVSRLRDALGLCDLGSISPE